MKAHSSGFKDQIKLLGREIDSKITYTLNGETIELGASELNSITPLFKGALLKSVMKELDIDSNVEIPLGTEINYQFGLKVNGTYEYLNYGNYIVNKVEKEEDTYSWKITCYDKILLSMVDYEMLPIEYPITIRSYINAICTKLGLTFANASDEFCNYDKQIEKELFLDSEGNSLNYTYRDVLDQLAEVTGSIICINNDDELELRYLEKEITPPTVLVNNLLDISQYQKGYLDNSGNFVSDDMVATFNQYIKVEEGIKYCLSLDWVVDNLYFYTYNSSQEFLNKYTYSDAKEGALNIPNGVKYIKVGVEDGYDEISDELIEEMKLMVELGNTRSETYEAYITPVQTVDFEILGETTQTGTPTPSNPIPMISRTGDITETIDGKQYTFSLGTTKLKGIGDYKDKIFRSGNKWYIKKVVNEKEIDGTENGWTYSSNKKTYYLTLNDVKVQNITSNMMDIASNLTNYGTTLNNDSSLTIEYGFFMNNQYLHIRNKNLLNKLTQFKNWLSENNVTIQYPYKTIQAIEITDETLLNQLNSVGVNTETINEEYLKDINVKFGEKFGPVNTVVLSRSAGSDNIYLSDPEDLADEDKISIVIKDNQIMNFNDRDQYLQDLLDTLKGTEFYINDYSSTGVAYLELGDLYNVNVGEETYKCLMLNDTLNVSQGLSEDIFTDKPDKSETDYKKADKTDRRINQAFIIVDKQNQQIEALTSQVTTIENTVGNSYTKEEVNQLIQTANEGVTNNFINSGGNNLLRNTGLWFEDRSEIEYMYPQSSLYPSDNLFMSADPHWEYWKGNAKKVKEDKASNLSGILLQTGYFEQQQQVRNGTYTLSFKYRKLIELATVNVQINDRYLDLVNIEDTEIIEVGEITAQNISIKIFSDTDDSCVIYDLMLNAGSEKAEYSQHQNETTTDTVNISKGITIQSSDTNTTFKANSDGIRVYNSKDMDTPITEYTDTGMDTNRIKVKDEAEIIQVLWKNVGNNTWISRL